MTISPISGRGSAEVITKKKLFGGEVLVSATLSFPVRIGHAGEEEDAEIILPDIAFQVTAPEAVYGRAFAFPINPNDGYIDGSVYYAGVHNPVDCDQITFLSAIGSSVSLKIHCVIDFAFEGPQELGKQEETFMVELPILKK